LWLVGRAPVVPPLKGGVVVRLGVVRLVVVVFLLVLDWWWAVVFSELVVFSVGSGVGVPSGVVPVTGSVGTTYREEIKESQDTKEV
jgi:hypothetical protein